LPSPTREKSNRPGRPTRQVGSTDKRDQILDAAEALFAQYGFHGVTVRQVTSEANVDVALVYYYFENKRALFDAVLLRRATIVNKERLEALEQLEQAGLAPEDGCAIEKLVAAFVDPIYRYLATGDSGWRHYFALIAQINNAPEWGAQVMPGFFDPVAQKLIEILRRVMPGAADDDLFWSFDFLSGALTLTLAGTGRIDRLSGGICLSTDYASIQQRLPRYVAAGFRQLYADRQAAKKAAS
jgi:AcrR family transcriptional regulator